MSGVFASRFEASSRSRSMGARVSSSASPGSSPRGGGYHDYPTEARVRDWIDGAGLRLVDEGRSPGEGYRYWHLIMTERSS
jgi:hypothetical protein